MKTNLGFGFLRLPLKDKYDLTSIDYTSLNKLVDAFLEKGFVRFDTAYTYHCGFSEEAVRKSLVERHSRDEFEIETKLPMHLFNSVEDMERIFSEQQKNCGVNYFDRYLLHSMNAEAFQKAEACGTFEFFQRKKRDGVIGKFGFSFHDSPEVLDEILAAHPETDFVLLQINYIDWENPGIQSRRCYETARKYGKPVFVMEPVKGGNLAKLPREAEELMKVCNPAASAASWAIRFAAGLDGVETVLSGMNSMEQILDNTSVMSDFKPLSSKEKTILEKVVEIIRQQNVIPCTGCRYCVEGCPQNIPIADYFALYNSAKSDDAKTASASSSQFFYYLVQSSYGGKASECIECGKCAEICPQHISIPKYMKDVAEIFEKNPSYPTRR